MRISRSPPRMKSSCVAAMSHRMQTLIFQLTDVPCMVMMWPSPHNSHTHNKQRNIFFPSVASTTID
jgi:hypothetical protein